MPCIVPIVEGEGDEEAVSLLLRRLINERQRWDWSVCRPIKSGGLSRLRKRLGDYLTSAQRRPGCQAILVLVDCDDDCPVDAARSLADQARQLHVSTSVAIVLAHREYESWLIASIETMAGRYGLPPGLVYEGAVEARRDAKGWLTSQMPPGQAYKETIDQAKLTSLLDLDRARQRSRSFRRFCDAVDELMCFAEDGPQGQVTPGGNGGR